MKSLSSLRIDGLSDLKSAWAVLPNERKRRHVPIPSSCTEDVHDDGEPYPYCHKKVIKQQGKHAVPIHRVGSKAEVAHGTAFETPGGLRRQDLVAVEKNGVVKFTSKKKRNLGETNLWAQAVHLAREELGLEGFVQIGGKDATGPEAELYDVSKRIYAELQAGKGPAFVSEPVQVTAVPEVPSTRAVVPEPVQVPLTRAVVPEPVQVPSTRAAVPEPVQVPSTRAAVPEPVQVTYSRAVARKPIKVKSLIPEPVKAASVIPEELVPVASELVKPPAVTWSSSPVAKAFSIGASSSTPPRSLRTMPCYSRIRTEVPAHMRMIASLQKANYYQEFMDQKQLAQTCERELQQKQQDNLKLGQAVSTLRKELSESAAVEIERLRKEFMREKQLADLKLQQTQVEGATAKEALQQKVSALQKELSENAAVEIERLRQEFMHQKQLAEICKTELQQTQIEGRTANGTLQKDNLKLREVVSALEKELSETAAATKRAIETDTERLQEQFMRQKQLADICEKELQRKEVESATAYQALQLDNLKLREVISALEKEFIGQKQQKQVESETAIKALQQDNLKLQEELEETQRQTYEARQQDNLKLQEELEHAAADIERLRKDLAEICEEKLQQQTMESASAYEALQQDNLKLQQELVRTQAKLADAKTYEEELQQRIVESATAHEAQQQDSLKLQEELVRTQAELSEAAVANIERLRAEMAETCEKELQRQAMESASAYDKLGERLAQTQAELSDVTALVQNLEAAAMAAASAADAGKRAIDTDIERLNQEFMRQKQRAETCEKELQQEQMEGLAKFRVVPDEACALRYEALEQDNLELRGTVYALQQELGQTKAELSETLAAAAAASTAVATLAESKRAVSEDIARLRRELDDQESLNTALQIRIQKQEKEIQKKKQRQQTLKEQLKTQERLETANRELQDQAFAGKETEVQNARTRASFLERSLKDQMDKNAGMEVQLQFLDSERTSCLQRNAEMDKDLYVLLRFKDEVEKAYSYWPTSEEEIKQALTDYRETKEYMSFLFVNGSSLRENLQTALENVEQQLDDYNKTKDYMNQLTPFIKEYESSLLNTVSAALEDYTKTKEFVVAISQGNQGDTLFVTLTELLQRLAKVCPVDEEEERGEAQERAIDNSIYEETTEEDADKSMNNLRAIDENLTAKLQELMEVQTFVSSLPNSVETLGDLRSNGFTTIPKETEEELQRFISAASASYANIRNSTGEGETLFVKINDSVQQIRDTLKNISDIAVERVLRICQNVRQRIKTEFIQLAKDIEAGVTDVDIIEPYKKAVQELHACIAALRTTLELAEGDKNLETALEKQERLLENLSSIRAKLESMKTLDALKSLAINAKQLDDTLSDYIDTNFRTPDKVEILTNLEKGQPDTNALQAAAGEWLERATEFKTTLKDTDTAVEANAVYEEVVKAAGSAYEMIRVMNKTLQEKLNKETIQEILDSIETATESNCSEAHQHIKTVELLLYLEKNREDEDIDEETIRVLQEKLESLAAQTSGVCREPTKQPLGEKLSLASPQMLRTANELLFPIRQDNFHKTKAAVMAELAELLLLLGRRKIDAPIAESRLRTALNEFDKSKKAFESVMERGDTASEFFRKQSEDVERNAKLVRSAMETRRGPTTRSRSVANFYSGPAQASAASS